jgi:TonB-linked SusC/RagA family outer membrane protein
MKKKRRNPIRESGWQKIFFKTGITVFLLFAGLWQAPASTVLASNPVEQQKREISGTVKDSKGVTLPGVSVIVKGTTQGTNTDLNGKFKILASADAKILVFSFIGMKNLELTLDGQTSLDVVLEEETIGVDEVVIVAFGKQKKESVIGSISSIKPAELKVPSSNLTTALAGSMAGIIAYQRSGEPGEENVDFFIRGVTTFGYKVDPLILIDGIELTKTDLSRLQPDDIASFSIMKDATATALYGARGANGVILVTTKEGKESKASVNIRIENSLSAPTRNVELADPITYMRLNNEAVLTRNPLQPQPYQDDKIDNTIAGTNPYAFPANNWRKELIKDYTMNRRVNMSVNGGGQTARYYVAGAFSQDNGVLKVDPRSNFNSNINLKSYNLRSNVNINLTKSTEMIVRLNGSFDDYTGPIDGGTGMYKKIMRANPVLFPAYYPTDESHAFVKHILFGNYENGNYLNPYADLQKGYKDYSRSLMLATLQLSQDLSSLTEGLSARVMVNTTRNAFFDVSRFYNPFYYSAGPYDKLTGTYNLSLLNENSGTEYLGYNEGDKLINSTFYLESALNYNHTFSKKHTLSGLLVYIMRQTLEANAGDLQRSLPTRNTGLSGRGTYSYENRYFAEFNFGYNGSERFYKTNRFGFFPSAGLAWSVSNEKFFAHYKPVISNLRLRATYGLVGNDAIGSPTDRFFYLSNVNMSDAGKKATFGIDNGYSRNGITISRYSNPYISWETATKTNFALELGLFNKVQIIAEYYNELRKNILMTRNIPSTAGLSAPVRANVGEAAGHGVDLSIDYSQFFGKDFWITSRANFTYATSKYNVYEEPKYKEQYLSRVGYPLSQQWGFIAERLFVDQNEVDNSPLQNFGEYGAGDIKFRDLNGDGQITSLDKAPIGFPTTPEIVYGFGFSTGYKGFDISAFFQGSARESFWIDVDATAPFISYKYPKENISSLLQNQLLKAYADDHWSEENGNLYALWPRLSANPNTNNNQLSTWFMRNGAFLRLKSLEAGYTLPKKVTTKFGMEKCRIYASGTNLLTLSGFKLWDIEMAGNGLGYPIQRVFNLGINVSF